MKFCKSCNKEKPLDDFYKQPKNSDGRQGTCKVCMNERTRKWYVKNPDKRRAKSRNNFDRKMKNPEFRKKHSEKTKLRKRPYLIHRDSKCRRCGFIPENICQLTVDHIDKNRNNNDVGNLQTLCHNCHNLKSWVEMFELEKLLLLNLIPSSGTCD